MSNEKNDIKFFGYITNLGKYNEGALVGKWIGFPITPLEMKQTLKDIEIGPRYEEFFMSDWDIDLGDGFSLDLGEYEQINHVNFLADLLSKMNPGALEAFKAAVSGDVVDGRNVDELINLAQNLDYLDFNPNIKDEYDLGYDAIEGDDKIPEYISGYIDYRSFGRDMMANEGGSITPYGYVRTSLTFYAEDADLSEMQDVFKYPDREL